MNIWSTQAWQALTLLHETYYFMQRSTGKTFTSQNFWKTRRWIIHTSTPSQHSLPHKYPPFPPPSTGSAPRPHAGAAVCKSSVILIKVVRLCMHTAVLPGLKGNRRRTSSRASASRGQVGSHYCPKLEALQAARGGKLLVVKGVRKSSCTSRVASKRDVKSCGISITCHLKHGLCNMCAPYIHREW